MDHMPLALSPSVPGTIEVRHEPSGVRLLGRRLEIAPFAQLPLEILPKTPQNCSVLASQRP